MMGRGDDRWGLRTRLLVLLGLGLLPWTAIGAAAYAFVESQAARLTLGLLALAFLVVTKALITRHSRDPSTSGDGGIMPSF